MKTNRLIQFGIGVMLATALILVATAPADAAAKKAAFSAPLIWRSDASGTYQLKDARLIGAAIAEDGSIVSDNSPATCEPAASYQTDGLVYGVTLNWTFTGKVTMEVSATGNSKDYVTAVNGVPLEYVNFVAGSNLKWKATLGPNSALTEVRLTYSDLSGVIGDFGSPLLSGFSARRKVYIKGSAAGELYNYQMQIKAGESQKTAGCDVKLNGAMKSDFDDIRFTQADGETILPHYLEAISGKAPDRVATFWLKVPQIPKDGLPIYVYYGRENAESLSDGGKVFDFYEHFEGAALDSEKWKVSPDTETGAAGIAGSLLSLDSAKIYTTDYKFDYGIIEYKAKAAGNSAVVSVIRAGSSSKDDLTAYSSTVPAAAHCVAEGVSIKANDPKPITLDTYYNYMIIRGAEGDITFLRYSEDPASAAEAEVKYAPGIQAAFPIGLSPGNLGTGMSCEFIRTRKYADPAPQVDIVRTSSGSAEAVNLPEFSGVITAENGDLVLAEKAIYGYYISKLISSPFKTRIITPSWDAQTPGKSSIAVGVSTREDGDFYTGWENNAARYVSKKEFEMGDKLRWKASLRGSEATSEGAKQSPIIKSFALEFYPGTIRVVMPNSKETVNPGSKYNILWETSGYEVKYPMDISYSKDSAAEFTAIASKASNSGNYAWDVPAGDFSKVVVKVADSFDASIYGLSEGGLSPSSQGAEGGGTSSLQGPEASSSLRGREAAEAIPDASGLQLYEILLKKSSGAPKPGEEAAYEEGDIIMIKPEGFLWGASERQNFTIVRAYLTKDEVREYMTQPETTDRPAGGFFSAKKKVREKRYKLDLSKKDLLEEEVAQMKGLTSGGPLVRKSAIIRK